MYKALVIGCGNIGAQYDIHNHEIQTHVKAWHLNEQIKLYIYDLDITLVQEVKKIYECDVLYSITGDTLSSFDCVSICTPTNTHSEFLKLALNAKIKTIICEKPITKNHDELIRITELYKKSDSKILVNYVRRFLPAFADLKSLINTFNDNEKLTNICIRYQRGFVNNCSHAFDLIEYLMNEDFILNNIIIHNKITDHFDDDPTLSMQALWIGANISVIGLSNVQFSHFEIDIYFEYSKILIKNAGDVIEIYQAKKAKRYLQPLILQPKYTRHNCLKNYMKFVTDYAVKLIDGKEQKDNFVNSVILNQRMVDYINI